MDSYGPGSLVGTGGSPFSLVPPPSVPVVPHAAVHELFQAGCVASPGSPGSPYAKMVSPSSPQTSIATLPQRGMAMSQTKRTPWVSSAKKESPRHYPTAATVAAGAVVEEQWRGSDWKGVHPHNMSKTSAEQMMLSAASDLNGDEVAEWLRLGLDINVADTIGMTCLHHAAAGGCEPLTKFLLQRGADVYAQEVDNAGGSSPLHHAIRGNYVGVARMLLENDPLSNTKKPEKGWLASNAALVNRKDALGMSPLHLSTRLGSVDMVKLLLVHGVNPEQKDDGGKLAVWWAKELGHNNIVSLLPASTTEYDWLENEKERNLVRPVVRSIGKKKKRKSKKKKK